jgi:hypothetical protein
MFFVKSFKGLRPSRACGCPARKTTYTKRNCLASRYISGLRDRDPEQLREPCALEHLDQGVTARLQDARGHLERQFRQVQGTGLVDDVDAAHVRRHVREHDVDLAARQQREEPLEDLLFPQVPAHELDSGQVRHRQHVARHHAPLRADAPRRVLAPRARRRSEVQAHRPGAQQPLAAVDVLELEYRARAPSFALRPLHERIREVLPEPPAAALRPPLHEPRRLLPHLQCSS